MFYRTERIVYNCDGMRNLILPVNESKQKGNVELTIEGLLNPLWLLEPNYVNYT